MNENASEILADAAGGAKMAAIEPVFGKLTPPRFFRNSSSDDLEAVSKAVSPDAPHQRYVCSPRASNDVAKFSLR